MYVSIQRQEKYRHYTEHHLPITLYHVAYRELTRLPRSNDDEIEVYRIVAQAIDYLSMFVHYMYLAMEIAVGLPPPEEMKVCTCKSVSFQRARAAQRQLGVYADMI